MKIWSTEEEAANLKKLFEAVGNKAEFVRVHKIKGGPSMLSQHLSGNRPMSLEAATIYAREFKKTLAEISPRLALEVENASKVTLMPDDSYQVMRGKNKVPVFGKSMGGLPDRVFTDEGRPVNGHDEYADVYSSDQAAFVVRVDGNSMYPKYEQGQYALVEPGTVPEVGDDVIFRCIKGEVMIKRLINAKGLYEFMSYNNNDVLRFEKDDIVWMYYVAHPVPSKKIKSRI